MEKTRVFCFDFDGTLTRRDTLLAFISFAFSPARLWAELLLLSPRLVAMKLGLADNGRTKERLFARLFAGWSVEKFAACCEAFARESEARLMRAEGLRAVEEALKSGGEVLIVSASVDTWVRPFFSKLIERFGADRLRLLGTQIETRDGVVTGRFLTKNCYGSEKVRRIEAALPHPHTQYHITAYGDSRGDKEMLDHADEAHFKPFR